MDHLRTRVHFSIQLDQLYDLQGCNGNRYAPDLNTTVETVEKLKSGYVVKFKVKNDGEYSAAAAVIKGELKEGEKAVETSTTTVAYVPSFSTRDGGVFFTKNPKDYKLELRATGYTEP